MVGTKLKLKEEISRNKDSPINEWQDLIGIETLIKNKYGPLVIEYDKTSIEKRKKFF